MYANDEEYYRATTITAVPTIELLDDIMLPPTKLFKLGTEYGIPNITFAFKRAVI